jgi:hypothetical protein
MVVCLQTFAHAHTAGQAFVLLLPTHLYVIGGATVVAASFVLVALLPTRAFVRAAEVRVRVRLSRRLLAVGRGLSTTASLGVLGIVLVLLAAGFAGSRDPRANPLPLFVWTVWWVGFTYLHALVGNLWAHVNPWIGIYRLATGDARGKSRQLLLRYPRRIAGYWPAVVGFLGFAWFELVHPAPADPAVLATAGIAHLLVHFAGIFLFGAQWLRYAEPLSVFFGVISRLAPFGRPDELADEARSDESPYGEIEITLPGLRLLSAGTPDASAVAFILLALSSVTFDGLARTFRWLAFLGENPLQHPGRTVLMLPNTLGLVGAFAGLALAYAVAARLAEALAGEGAEPGTFAPSLVRSIVPIAFGYHVAHYLPVFLVDLQHALRAASDPYGLGWNLLGTREHEVVTSFITQPPGVYTVWHTQVAIIVAAHVAAVFLAHVLTLRAAGSPARALLSQAPMLLLMIGYTMLGLWLLSAPSTG